jgi:hypothetical protein
LVNALTARRIALVGVFPAALIPLTMYTSWTTKIPTSTPNLLTQLLSVLIQLVLVVFVYPYVIPPVDVVAKRRRPEVVGDWVMGAVVGAAVVGAVVGSLKAKFECTTTVAVVLSF